MKIRKILLTVVMMIIFTTNVKAVEVIGGTYVTKDGLHSITIDVYGSHTYDGTYSLKLTEKSTGSTITGKLGTDKKTATFYQLNETKIVSGAVITYKEDGNTQYLYDYTVYSVDNLTPVVDVNGAFEVWHNGTKVNTYKDLQSAVDAATSGDTIKINKDLDITSGVYITGKSITIDGGNHTLNSSTWLNAIFVVEDDATLEIKNLTIDGGATGFEVNKSDINIQTGTSTTIPLVTGSDTSDPKRTQSVVISRGNLIIDSSNFNNNYINADAGTVNITTGNLTLSKTKFNHNRSNKGAALYIGSNFKSGQTDYSIENILIDNCEFSENYAKSGGAIYTYNVAKFSIKDTKFIKNTVTGGKGGAILINNQSSGEYWSMSEKYNLSLTKFNIDNCLFEENWVGNDGAALENHEAEVVISNTIFRKNVGIHSTSSCGTVSFYMDFPREIHNKVKMIISDSLFEENMGSASTIADHGSSLFLDVTNTKFIKNKAVYNSILLYSSNVNFTNCEFIEEYATRAVIDIQSYNYSTATSEAYPATITFNNVTIKDTANGTSDIVIRRKNSDYINFPWTIEFNGTNTANIDLWHNNKLVINGELNGDINTDSLFSDENLVIAKTAKINGDFKNNKDKVLVTLIYNDTDEIFGYKWEARKYIYLDEKEYSKKELFLEHLLSKENYELVLYTDKNFTNPWDYIVSSEDEDAYGSVNIYGKWEEHNHILDESLVLFKNKIYEQCECGYLGKKLSLKAPSETQYTGNKIEVIVNNELGIKTEDYKINYFIKKDGKWEEIEAPINAGEYKVTLTYKDMEIEQTYTITEKSIINIPIDVPNTLDNIIYYIVSLILSGVTVVGLVIWFKKKELKY